MLSTSDYRIDATDSGIWRERVFVGFVHLRGQLSKGERSTYLKRVNYRELGLDIKERGHKLLMKIFEFPRTTYYILRYQLC